MRPRVLKPVSLAASLLITASGAVCAQDTTSQTKRPNVLLIAVDDLRPSFGAYGGPIKTPHIDKLAARGTTFLRAYCQQAVCSPSRTSLLTGLRPDTTRIYDLQTHFRTTIPSVVTLPQHFKQNGYHAQGMGKIYHGGLDDKDSWSVPHMSPRRPQWGPETMKFVNKINDEAKAAGRDVSGTRRLRGPAWESVPDVPDNHFHDGRLADRAIEALNANKGRPFFLAVGFNRPHLPFVAPKKYWDLYKDSDIKLPENYKTKPENGVPIALTGWGELRAYHGIPKQGTLTDEQARKMIHGYYASASYMDAQVGRLLGELDRLGLWENTVVVLWGDHGWHLGDHGQWCKHTNFEKATHSPLILSVPGQKAPGGKAKGLAEFVDIYPTLCAAAGLSAPQGLAGMSLLPATNDPGAATKPAAFSQYPRGNARTGRVMGYSLRTDRYRYTEWGANGAELYDHEKDPDENINIAGKRESRAIVAELSKMLHAAYPGAAKQAAEQGPKQPDKTLGGVAPAIITGED